MAAPEVWHGRQGTILIGDATSVDTATTLEQHVSSADDRSGLITDITVTDPEASVDILNHFSGQVKTESPHDLVTVDFTMRFKDLEMFQYFHGASSTITTGSSWVRISGGSSIGSRSDKAVLFKVSDGTNTVSYLLNNAWFTQMGEISLAADGTAELTGTAVCLIEDRYIEQNF